MGLSTIVNERVGHPWCLFLDRDGVVNTRIMGGYVQAWEEFHFEPGALNALALLSRWAPRIVLVTNQQGIGKAFMSESDLALIHDRMRREIALAGGRIDAVRYCPHLAADACACRKPRPGMAIDYLRAHPEIDGALSVMVGDTPSDIEMGRRLAHAMGGGATVRIADSGDPSADVTSPNLAAFAAEIAAIVEDGDHVAE